MCGIAGAFVFDGDFEISPGYVARMRDTMAHRGPDGSGTWIDDDCRVGLGFRRLAIIDLSPAAMQPMANEDGSLRLIFNGEIYNHAAIRAELEQLGGHTWKTDHADAEVILHAFEEWGIACLARFRGMFAFALWDGRERALWLVRDRIGIKPLYYSIHDGRITFASEIKALLTDPLQRRAINEEALFDYLSFLTTPAPTTLFEGISKLPPGSWLRVASDGTLTERRWWDVWDHVSPLTAASDDEIAERVLDALQTAVNLRKVSDVPVGVFLSGGVDSSTNAALFSTGEQEPIKTFSIGYEGDYPSYPNELHHARRMAAEVGADHHELLLTQDNLIDFLPRMVQLQDEPIADPVCVPLYYVSKLARDHGVVVAQAGEGADELFCGYPSWHRALRMQQVQDLPIPSLARSAGLASLQAIGRNRGRTFESFRRGALGQPVFWGGAEAFTQRMKENLLSARLRQDFGDRTSWQAIEPIRRRFEANAWEPSTLNWMTYVDLNLRLPELLLMRIDKMSMGASVEARVPFLDHEFVSLVMSIPTAVKIRNGTPKYLLKKAVRGIVPDELIDRPKQGFGVPVAEWLTGRLGDHIRAELDTFCTETDILDRTAVNEVLARPGGHDAWYLYNLAGWWREYVRD
jgi:asparagine synthase (glutamine-hydrolysing)